MTLWLCIYYSKFGFVWRFRNERDKRIVRYFSSNIFCESNKYDLA